jgi:hypothetical protein
MPYYEYRCPSNGRTIEVRHAMDERLETWGEVASRAGLDTGGTPPQSPVERILSVPVAVSGPAPEANLGCGPGCACARPA